MVKNMENNHLLIEKKNHTLYKKIKNNNLSKLFINIK